jgi:hypothetical protein
MHLPDTPRNELRVLGSEIDYDYLFVRHYLFLSRAFFDGGLQMVVG